MEKSDTHMGPKGIGNKYSDSEFIKMVREHKHNYAPDFGNVVSTPARRLFDSLINYPGLYTDQDERERIIDAFIKAIRMQAIYEQIGLKLDEQLERIHQNVIPTIHENAALFQDILVKHKDLPEALIKRLRFSLNRTDELCHKLENLESEEYGVAEDFLLRDEILKAFRLDNNNTGIEGKKGSIQVFTNLGEYADVKTHMPKDVFITHVIGNIINNFHKHAFTDEVGTEKNISTLVERDRSLSLFKRLWSLFKRMRSWFAIDTAFFTDPEIEIIEKQVQIEFKNDESRPNRLNIIIRNNGTPFNGDTTSVFDYGVGTGSGIGLYSAKCFLNKYDADIKMESTPDEEYTVSFIINLPIIST